MFTFHKVIDKKFPQYEGWKLKISTHLEFIKYHDLMVKSEIESAFSDLQVNALFHKTTSLSSIVEMMSKASGDSLAISLCKIVDQREKAQLKVLDEGNTLYINPNGSWCCDFPETPIYDIIDIAESEELIFPDVIFSNVRYIQWNNGFHWYAKVNTLDIVVDGEQKWNSKEEAEEAVKRYFRDKGHGIS